MSLGGGGKIIGSSPALFKCKISSVVPVAFKWGTATAKNWGTATTQTWG